MSRLLILFILLITFFNEKPIHASGKGKPADSQEKPSRTRKVKVVYLSDSSDEDSPTEKRKHEEWKERFNAATDFPADARDVTRSERTAAFSRLKGNERPLAREGEVYLGGYSEASSTSGARAGERASYVGEGRKANYISREDAGGTSHYEAFCDPTIASAKIKRKEPDYIQVYSLSQGKMVTTTADRRRLKANADEIFFDAGHGIDHAKTITYKGSNSSHDSRNYTPQNAYYNRSVRKPAVSYATKQKFTYKELAIYGEKPLEIKVIIDKKEIMQPVPEGFVFFLINQDGSFESAYYFSNYQHYQKDKKIFEAEKRKKKVSWWKFLAEKYTIPKETAEIIWGYEDIAEGADRRRALYTSSRAGHQALSGRFEVVPDNDTWTEPVRAALVRTVAAYKVGRAAEYDPSIEHMLSASRLFNDSDFTYMEFRGNVYAPSLAKYWLDRAIGEIKRKDYPAKDVFYLLDHFEYGKKALLEPAVLASIVDTFEGKLRENLNTGYILDLMKYFSRVQDSRYNGWSAELSRLVLEEALKGSKSLKERDVDEKLEAIVADVDVTSICLDCEMSDERFSRLLKGFESRAIREQREYQENMKFLEITSITGENLRDLLSAFENGYDHKGKKIYVDVRRTSLKLPEYNALKVREYVGKNFPKIAAGGLRFID